MKSQYWVQCRKSTHGPFSADQLRQFIRQGKLKADHHVSRDQQAWTIAAEVKGLTFPADERIPSEQVEVAGEQSPSTAPSKKTSDDSAQTDAEPVLLTCTCGRTYSIDVSVYRENLTCPACKQPLTVSTDSVRIRLKGPSTGLLLLAPLNCIATILLAISFVSRQQLPEFAGVVGIAVAIVPCVLIMMGAGMMRSLDSHKLANLGAFLSVLPVWGPVLWLGIPLGIWALSVLNRPEVKNSFSFTSASRIVASHTR